MARKDVTISDILYELAGDYDGVVPERTVFDRVLERRPSTAKHPYSSMRTQIRYEGPRLGWIGLGKGELMPLHTLLQHLRFRVVPDEAERTRGGVLISSFYPFIREWPENSQAVDADGVPIMVEPTTLPEESMVRGSADSPAIAIAKWFADNEFVAGDSLLATILNTAPLQVRFEHERARNFRAEAVMAQDQALIDGVFEQINRQRGSPVFAETLLLPIYGRAAWRTSYPGRPWRELVARDRRLRLFDRDMIADASFRSGFDTLFGGDPEAQQDENEQELLRQINALQDDLRLSRRSAVERGLWDGMAPRVSTAQTLFDFEAGTSTTIYPGAVDALEDHSATIEEHIANGDYEDEEWSPEDAMLELENADDDDEFIGLDDIDDVQAFVDQNPEIAAATRRLMDSLTPEEQRRLDSANSIEDVQQVLGPHLADLMRHEPALFVPLTPDMYEYIDPAGNGNGHSTNGNGNGHNHDEDLLSNTGWEDDPSSLDESDEWLDGDDIDLGDEVEIGGATSESIDAAVERSSQLLDQFVEFQVRTGKSTGTASGRAGDLWLYADFLARYYGRALDQGDYATLDECLFFYYPRKVLNSSPRNARELCTSAKQFYAFLKTEQVVADDAFANAIWQRRDQAARVVELYDQIDGDSQQFDRLFAHLFAPYTA